LLPLFVAIFNEVAELIDFLFSFGSRHCHLIEEFVIQLSDFLNFFAYYHWLMRMKVDATTTVIDLAIVAGRRHQTHKSCFHWHWARIADWHMIFFEKLTDSR
jgi:hypothetical protein